MSALATTHREFEHVFALARPPAWEMVERNAQKVVTSCPFNTTGRPIVVSGRIDPALAVETTMLSQGSLPMGVSVKDHLAPLGTLDVTVLGARDTPTFDTLDLNKLFLLSMPRQQSHVAARHLADAWKGWQTWHESSATESTSFNAPSHSPGTLGMSDIANLYRSGPTRPGGHHSIAVGHLTDAWDRWLSWHGTGAIEGTAFDTPSDDDDADLAGATEHATPHESSHFPGKEVGAYSWNAEAAKIVRRIARIPKDWAGPDSVRPSQGIISAIERVSRLLPASTRVPDVDVDDSTGTVTLTWSDVECAASFSLVFPKPDVVVGVVSTTQGDDPRPWKLDTKYDQKILQAIEGTPYSGLLSADAL